jgi:N-acetylglutamate synthase-like GNAT family acetyltransferase
MRLRLKGWGGDVFLTSLIRVAEMRYCSMPIVDPNWMHSGRNKHRRGAGGGSDRAGGRKNQFEIRGWISILRAMSPSHLQARRATLDDIPSLRNLWEMMRYPVAELEKQLTDFQVVVDAAGEIIGAVGFRTLQRQGCIHSEAFGDFSLAERARPVLWERIESLCTNHGVVRLWTNDPSPFWTHNGFKPCSPAVLEKLPEVWDRKKPGWVTLQLRDENVIASLDKEFAMFVASERQRSEQALGQAKVLKTIVTVITLLIAFGILVAAAYVFLHRRGALPTP